MMVDIPHLVDPEEKTGSPPTLLPVPGRRNEPWKVHVKGLDCTVLPPPPGLAQTKRSTPPPPGLEALVLELLGSRRGSSTCSDITDEAVEESVEDEEDEDLEAETQDALWDLYKSGCLPLEPLEGDCMDTAGFEWWSAPGSWPSWAGGVPGWEADSGLSGNDDLWWTGPAAGQQLRKEAAAFEPMEPYPPTTSPSNTTSKKDKTKEKGLVEKQGLDDGSKAAKPEKTKKTRTRRSAKKATKLSPGPVTVSETAVESGSGVQLEDSLGDADAEQTFTTVMMRNIPNDYSGTMLIELLDQQGFSGLYNLVYLPMDYHRKAGFGYAFIDLTNNEEAIRFRDHFEGFTNWGIVSHKICEVSWSDALQGVQAHIDRYRNSPVMHGVVPDEFKPMLFENGEQVSFPSPTKSVRAPRLRKKDPRLMKGPRRLTAVL